LRVLPFPEDVRAVDDRPRQDVNATRVGLIVVGSHRRPLTLAALLGDVGR
jgi:hypothetical protein